MTQLNSRVCLKHTHSRCVILQRVPRSPAFIRHLVKKKSTKGGRARSSFARIVSLTQRRAEMYACTFQMHAWLSLVVSFLHFPDHLECHSQFLLCMEYVASGRRKVSEASLKVSRTLWSLESQQCNNWGWRWGSGSGDRGRQS